MPRLARANSPDSYSTPLPDRAFSRCREPTTRSSPAPTGSSTRRTGRVAEATEGGCGPSGQSGSGAAGSQENRQSVTTVIGGSRAACARTAVDFAVPFSPRIRTPPMSGLIPVRDRKSTRLNSSHVKISYAVFCVKKKTDVEKLDKKTPKRHIVKFRHKYRDDHTRTQFDMIEARNDSELEKAKSDQMKRQHKIPPQ